MIIAGSGEALFKVAIIGSGPSGCYLAEKLVQLLPGCEIDILEKELSPFGLVRAGVAPDHQSTKAASRRLARILERPGVRYWGNVEVGKHVKLKELRAFYDATIIACGIQCGRRLGAPGEDTSGVCESLDFAYWANGCGDGGDIERRLKQAKRAVIIGNGNVALDVARLLAKTKEELARAPLRANVARALGGSALQEIHIVGRRSPRDVKFTPHELQEFETLQGASPILTIDDVGAADKDEPVLKILRRFAAADPPKGRIPIKFHFHMQLSAFCGESELSSVRFKKGRQEIDLPADIVFKCIGYQINSFDGAAIADGVIVNDNGRIEDDLWVVGWAKRGPVGVIATNRTESHDVAARIAETLRPSDKKGRILLDFTIKERQCRVVTLDDWRHLEALQTSNQVRTGDLQRVQSAV